MTQTLANPRRPKRLGEPGRAQTVNTSLTREQYAWVLAQGLTVAQVLRQCVQTAMDNQPPVAGAC